MVNSRLRFRIFSSIPADVKNTCWGREGNPEPEWKPILGGYLGLFLYGAALLAVGLFISTLTENQIVAGVVTLGLILVLWLIDSLAAGAEGVTRDVLGYLSVIGHLDDFIKGVIDTANVIFYLTFAFFGLFLTYRSLESLRWKS